MRLKVDLGQLSVAQRMLICLQQSGQEEQSKGKEEGPAESLLQNAQSKADGLMLVTWLPQCGQACPGNAHASMQPAIDTFPWMPFCR